MNGANKLTRKIRMRSICTIIIVAALMFGCVSSFTTTPQPAINVPPQETRTPTASAATSTLEPVPTASSTPIPTPTSTILPTSTLTPEIIPTNTSAPSETTAPVGDLIVHFIDVGQGDAILVITPDKRTALIDGGETNTGIVQYLKSIGITHLDLVVATHPHSDHIGGLVQVLQAIPVDKVVTNGVPYTTFNL